MADGDEIHTNLPRRYLNNYKDLCAPNFDIEGAAYDIAKTVIRDVKDFGNAPVHFIASVTSELAQDLNDTPFSRATTDYGHIQRTIDQIARDYQGNPKAMELAKREVRRGIEDYREGGNFPSAEVMLGNYLYGIQEARFSDLVPMTKQHLEGMSSNEITQRLNEIRPYTRSQFEHVGRSLAKNPNVDRRINRRSIDSGLGLKDELF